MPQNPPIQRCRAKSKASPPVCRHVDDRVLFVINTGFGLAFFLVPIVHQGHVKAKGQIESRAEADGAAIFSIGATVKEDGKVGTPAGGGDFRTAAVVFAQFSAIAEALQDFSDRSRVAGQYILGSGRQRSGKANGQTDAEFFLCYPSFVFEFFRRRFVLRSGYDHVIL